MNLWLIFITGLTTGGLSCLAMQGGLLASTVANTKKKLSQDVNNPSKLPSNGDWLPVAMFLGAKLISHTLLGFLLGSLGSVLTLSLSMRIAFQILAALFMLATALNLLNVHPIFRFVSFQPPKFMQRWVKGSTRMQTFFAPAVLGFFTIFIPCGVTQAMEVLAINSGNPITGALILFVFVLGTSPLFGLIGIATAKLSDGFRNAFMKFAGILLIAMSLWSVNGVLQVVDAPISWQRLQLALSKDDAENTLDVTTNPQMNVEIIQRVHISVQNEGYRPNKIKVRAGQPVELTLETNNIYTCATAFTFREFGLYAQLDPTDKEVFRFTPEKPGRYVFSCSMGMYTGVLEVI